MTRRDHQEGSLGGWLWASWRAGRAGWCWASYAWTWTWTWSLQLSEAPGPPSTERVGLLLHIPPEGQSRLLEDPNRYCLSLKITCRYQTCRSSRYVFSLSPTSAIQSSDVCWILFMFDAIFFGSLLQIYWKCFFLICKIKRKTSWITALQSYCKYKIRICVISGHL